MDERNDKFQQAVQLAQEIVAGNCLGVTERELQRGQIEQWLEGARDPNGHPGWHPSTNGEIAALCELALKALPSAAAAEYAKRNPLGGPAAPPSKL